MNMRSGKMLGDESEVETSTSLSNAENLALFLSANFAGCDYRK